MNYTVERSSVINRTDKISIKRIGVFQTQRVLG